MDSDNAITKDTLEAWVRLNRTHNLLHHTIEAALKRAQLPPLVWYDVLLELYKAGGGGLRQFEIAHRMLLPKHNLSRLLDRLQERELIKRTKAHSDARGNVIVIQKQGQRLLKDMWRVYGGILREHFQDPLSSAQLQQLTASLATISAGMDPPENT